MHQLALDEYDFLDFGCSDGGSIRFAQRKLRGGRGLGIDLSQTKVDAAKAAGFEAVQCDVRDLTRQPRSVRFVTMMHFLEHLPSVRDAATCVRAASEVARDFIFIRQPWFDSDGYLFSLGLKLYWSDWSGHPNAMTSLELHNIVSRIARVAQFRVYGVGLITRASDPAVHPLASPVNQHEWSADTHPAKGSLHFSQPIYRQIMCIATLAGGDGNLAEIERTVPFDTMIFGN